MSKILIADDLGCAYRYDEENKQLQYCPLSDGGLLWDEDWGYIEEDLVGEEVVTFEGQDITLSEVYRIVENRLGKI